MWIFVGFHYQESAYPTTASIIQEKTSGSILIHWHTCIRCWVLHLDSPLFAWPSYPVQLQERHIFSSPMVYSISCTLQLTWKLHINRMLAGRDLSMPTGSQNSITRYNFRGPSTAI
jgi:hypothetical protein